MGVPGAFVWAVLAFVTNFIPNIGFVIGVIPPALIALLDSGPGLMIAVIVVYSVINFVIQSVIQPRVVGDTVGLSPILTFLSLVFWTWVDRATGRAARRTAQPAHQGPPGRSRPRRTVGSPPDLRQSRTRPSRRSRRRRSHPRSLGPPPRFGWEELGGPGPPILADAPGTYVFDN